MSNIFSTVEARYEWILRRSVWLFALLAGVSVVLMMLTTCADVVLRAFGHPLQGSYDVVRLLGALAISFALPYTTAVKGHVAVEFFFHKLPHRGRIVVDSMIRLVLIGLFALLGWQSVLYGVRLEKSGTVTATLQLPVFWVPYVIAASSAVVLLVVLHNLLHPGKVMIKP